MFQSLVDMAPKYILEQFLEAELLINITEHLVSWDFYNIYSYVHVHLESVRYMLCITLFEQLQQ